MSRTINKVTLVGNVGADPENIMLPSGSQKTTFSVATNQRWRDRHGEWQENTDWHSCVAWAGQAQNIAAHVRKGDPITIFGELRYRTYENRSGDTVRVAEIHVREYVLAHLRNRSPEPAVASAGAYDDFGGDDLPL